jgi:hypothetical protein
MTTIRLLPPADLPPNGHKVFDTEDVKAAILARNGWHAIGLVGTTAERPADGLPKGVPCYIDTTLKKPIFHDGNTWRDCLGNIV